MTTATSEKSTKTIKIETFDGFTLYKLDYNLFVIRYESSYSTASRARLYQSRKGAEEKWNQIKNGVVTYVDF